MNIPGAFRVKVQTDRVGPKQYRVARFFEFHFIVNLNQCVELLLSRQREEILQLGRLEHRDDEKDRARPGRAGFINLKGVEHEVLAQNGQARCAPDSADPAKVALKKIL